MRRGTTCAGKRIRERGKEGVVLCVCIESTRKCTCMCALGMLGRGKNLEIV